MTVYSILEYNIINVNIENPTGIEHFLPQKYKTYKLNKKQREKTS